MIPLSLSGARQILCLGSHCDDIEIGCGGTILQLLESNPESSVHWIVFASNEVRKREAQQSAERFLSKARTKRIVVRDFRESFFPYQGLQIKESFEQLKSECKPDVIFTHYRADLHQDHRVIAEFTWNTFRDHLILEYEIPKYDGDLGAPNVFVPLSEEICRRKVDTVLECFASQQHRQWFSRDTFYAMLRIRGIEANSPTRHAEAFYGKKLCLGPGIL
jgi:LmbE family N-acetylglucosaminyl deacetylase